MQSWPPKLCIEQFVSIRNHVIVIYLTMATMPLELDTKQQQIAWPFLKGKEKSCNSTYLE